MVEQYKKNLELQQSLDVPARLITPQEAREIVPYLNTDGLLAATFCPTDGHINPFIATNSYAQAARRLGATVLIDTEVTGIEVAGDKVVAVQTSRGKSIIKSLAPGSPEVAVQVKAPHLSSASNLVTEAVAPSEW